MAGDTIEAKRDAGKSGANRLGAPKGDALRFFRTWLRHPLKLGAVAPSSARYCAAMAARATTHLDGPVLELGSGLGAVTQALIDKGVAPERITSVEFDPGFAAALQRRFPGVNVVEGDGLFGLGETLGAQADARFAAILFAIPILNFPQERRQALFSGYFRRLVPSGNLTQLSYLQSAPVKPVPGVFSVSASPMVWDNIPPARVWIYAPADVAGSGAR